VSKEAPSSPVPNIPEAAKILVDFVPTKEFFVGIDSDGCAMDAMDIKHQECFTPSYIKYWNLQPISTLARETAIFVNLGSVTRGLNRWLALRQLLDLLRDRVDVAERGVTIPAYPELTDFIESDYPLSDRASGYSRDTVCRSGVPTPKATTLAAVVPMSSPMITRSGAAMGSDCQRGELARLGQNGVADAGVRCQVGVEEGQHLVNRLFEGPLGQGEHLGGADVLDRGAQPTQVLDPGGDRADRADRHPALGQFGAQRGQDPHGDLQRAIRGDLREGVADVGVAVAVQQRLPVRGQVGGRQRDVRARLVPPLLDPALAARVADRVGDRLVPEDRGRVGQQRVGAVEQGELAALEGGDVVASVAATWVPRISWA